VAGFENERLESSAPSETLGNEGGKPVGGSLERRLTGRLRPKMKKWVNQT